MIDNTETLESFHTVLFLKDCKVRVILDENNQDSTVLILNTDPKKGSIHPRSPGEPNQIVYKVPRLTLLDLAAKLLSSLRTSYETQKLVQIQQQIEKLLIRN